MKNNDWQLTTEEKKLIEAIREGKTISVMGEDDKGMLVEMASQTLKRRKPKKISVNLRLDKDDINLAKKRAEVEGMGYQTLLGSVIHKWVNNNLEV